MIMAQKRIAKIWASGKSTACLVLGKEIAEEYNLTDDDHVTVEGTNEGILIKRLEI
jgi:antitoxin component of MazEF toxin-antitoxin module